VASEVLPYKFSASPISKTIRWIQNVFNVLKRYEHPESPYQVWWGSELGHCQVAREVWCFQSVTLLNGKACEWKINTRSPLSHLNSEIVLIPLYRWRCAVGQHQTSTQHFYYVLVVCRGLCAKVVGTTCSDVILVVVYVMYLCIVLYYRANFWCESHSLLVIAL